MPTTTQPNIGLHAGWTANEGNWGDKMNANLRAIDTLMQASVISANLTAPPGGVSEGATFIIGPAAGGDWSGLSGQIARWSVTGMAAPAWEYFTPKIGWIVWNLATGLPLRFTQTGWVIGSTDIAGVDGLEAALDAKANREVAVLNSSSVALTLEILHLNKCLRMGAASAISVTVPPSTDVAFPLGAVVPVRQVGAGQVTILPGVGVTLLVPTGALAKSRVNGSTMMLHKVGTDTWDIGGDLAAS